MAKAQDLSQHRLQNVLARHGVASRRGAATIIEKGLVQVNGKIVREKGFRVDPTRDAIVVQGRGQLPKSSGQSFKYFLFNKPVGVTTSMKDEHAESTVADFFDHVVERVVPVGRLDRDTSGLLLLTNDGNLAFKLSHPRYGVIKTYRALIRGKIPDGLLGEMTKGVPLEEGVTAPCRIQVRSSSARQTELMIFLHEGKKRQIRRMFEWAGYPVVALERVAYSFLKLGQLRPGQSRALGTDEIKLLKAEVGDCDA